MLTYFSVIGFKNFKEKIVFDLKNISRYTFNEKQIKNNTINKGIIYGKNGEGKSNLGEAIFDIELNLMLTVSVPDLNIYKPTLKGIYKNMEYDKDVEFEYHFEFDNDEIVYRYSKKESMYVNKEKLYINKKLLLSNNEGDVTCYIKEAENVNFANKNIKSSALFFLFNFIKFDENNILNKLFSFLKGMLWFRCLNQGNEAMGAQTRYDYIEDTIVRKNKLTEYQLFLNSFGLNYQLQSRQITNPFFPQQKIYTIETKIGKNTAPLNMLLSTGSIALELYFYWSITFSTVTFLFIDEFDAFYHYEISESIIKLLNEQINFQSFVTTHNTSLMSTKLMRPDNLFLISNNKIKPLCDCTTSELRNGHNLEKIYKEGGFDE